MASIQFFWDQKYEQQQKVKNSDAIIDNLQRYIQELLEQNQNYKNRVFQVQHKINQAQTQLQSISDQKQKFQEFYKSYSCCDLSIFNRQAQINEHNNKQISKKICESCIDSEVKFNQQRQRLIHQNNNKIKQKEAQIQTLKKENESLQRRYDDLVEQYNLIKMQIELAEIAIKDVSQRALSLNNSSLLSKNDEFCSGKSYDQFINGDLQCISNFNDSFMSQRNTNNLRMSLSSNQVNVQWNSSSINNSAIYDQNQNTQPISFKKKHQENGKNIRMHTEPNLQHKISFQTEPSFKKSVLNSYKYQKTVTIQCDLLKNVPKIKLFTKEKVNDKKKQVQQIKQLKSQIKGQKVNVVKKEKILSKSEIMSEKMLNFESKKSDERGCESVGPLHKFFSFFTNKVITSRIKTK